MSDAPAVAERKLTMGITTSELAPAIGTIVSGIDLAAGVPEARLRWLIDLLFDRGVLVIEQQHLSDAQYAAFGEHWGKPLEFFIPEHRNADFPAIIRINNDPRTPLELRDGAVHWHSDSSYESVPAAVTMLYGIEAPVEGGITQFASTAAAYDDLPAEMKSRLDGMVALHELGRAPWIEGETVPDPNRPSRATEAPRHPLVMVHPVTGRKGLFTSGTAYAIEGMAQEEATTLIRFLREHVTKPKYRAAYKVRAGDVVLWDNFGTVHCASPIDYSDAPGKRRLLHRISTKGLPRLLVEA
jgi:taurine dioxygenase